MSKNITNSESISTLKSKKKNKSQEIGESTKDSIKNILKSNGNKILFNDKEIQTIIENKREGDLGNLTIEQKIQYDNILLIANCLKNLDRTKMKNYIHRKNEYLEKNRTISKENFEELFRGSGKFGKAEINQQNLGICYAYTGFELLKKTNGFDEMIQTNLKEIGNGWEVRMPFCDKNGKWITVNESEIDKKFSITRKTFNINSKSEYKGFKILEIAFIKQSIIKKYFNKKENIPEELEDAYIQYSKTGDISLTGELITKLEGGLVEDMLKNILPKNYIISNISDERLNNEMKDLAFNQFSKGLFKIDLQMNRKNVGENNIGPSTTIVKNFKIGKTIIINNAIIINKKTEKIENKFSVNKEGYLSMNENTHGDNLEYIESTPDIVKNEFGENVIMIVPLHSYSIEKCYTNKNNEKRVQIINPHHTGIIFDISLEQCKEIFNRGIIGIDIDEMFR